VRKRLGRLVHGEAGHGKQDVLDLGVGGEGVPREGPCGAVGKQSCALQCRGVRLEPSNREVGGSHARAVGVAAVAMQCTPVV